MDFPTRAQVRVIVQLVLTATLTPLCLAIVFLSLGSPTAQKLAAAWIGIVLGYWFK